MMATTRYSPTVPSVVGGGKWVWRDDTNMLEFIGSSNVSYEGGGSRQQRRQKVTDRKKDRDRTTPLQQFASGVTTQGPTSNSYREHFTNLPSTITIQDIKAISLARLREEGNDVTTLHDCSLVDEMIACTLNFFHFFFIDNENRRPKPMMAEQEEHSKELADRADMIEAHKKLSTVYSAFLLGLRSEDIHHLCGGKLRYSKTRQDKSFYENLYQCLITCTILNFQTADPDVVKTEMGRLFRSDSFNINQRELSQRELESKYPDYFRLKGLNGPNSGPTPAEYRRLRNKRNPFGTAITKQSPIVEGMLKNPQQLRTEVTSSDLMCNGIGVIGKSIRDYDLGTLRELDEKEKKELELNENFSSRASSVIGGNMEKNEN